MSHARRELGIQQQQVRVNAIRIFFTFNLPQIEERVGGPVWHYGTRFGNAIDLGLRKFIGRRET